MQLSLYADGSSHARGGLPGGWAWVLVNALGPIITVTPMTAERIKSDAARYERMLLNVPMGRMADIEDLVGPTVFLASAASDFITGTVLYVDGGTMAFV